MGVLLYSPYCLEGDLSNIVINIETVHLLTFMLKLMCNIDRVL